MFYLLLAYIYVIVVNQQLITQLRLLATHQTWVNWQRNPRWPMDNEWRV